MGGRAEVGIALLALAACGSGGDSTPETTREPVTSWIGETLEGGTVVVVADGNTSFVGEIPAPVEVILGAADCESLFGAIEFWTSRMSDASVRDTASAYVLVARGRLAELGCGNTGSG
jgi:hypothetical protein